MLYGMFLKTVPPQNLIMAKQGEDEQMFLLDWCVDNLKPCVSYATGLSIIEAVEMIVQSQVENGLEKLERE